MATVEAHITRVQKDEATGWYSIETDSAEVKKLTTQKDEPAKAAAALRRDGALAVITYTLREKPREGGGTFKNYYIDKAVAAQNGGSDDGIETVRSAPQTRTTDPKDAWRMCLNKGGELAVSTMPLMDVNERDFDTQKRIAFAWARFFFFTPVPSADQPAPAFADQPAGGPGAYDEPEWGPSQQQDDDIPF